MISFPSLTRKKVFSSNKIRHILRLRHMLRQWRKKVSVAPRRTKTAVAAKQIPSDVPSGHLAVCVGSSSRRFVVRATYLNHPAFGKLLDQAQEEYGYANSGPLAIPCEEALFEELLGYLGQSESGELAQCLGRSISISSKSARYLGRSISSKSARFTNLGGFHSCRFDARSNSEFRPESQPLLNGLLDRPVSVW